MRTVHHTVCAVTASMVLMACAAKPAPAQPTPEERLIAEIESGVSLPAGAAPLSEYSRNYALQPDGKVLAIYVKTFPRSPPTQGCEVMEEDFNSRPCTKEEIAELNRREQETAELFGEAGQSRWFDDHRSMPWIDDGGCDLIEIIYVPTTKAFELVACNGVA